MKFQQKESTELLSAIAFNEYGRWRTNPEAGEKCLHSKSINVLYDRKGSLMKLLGGACPCLTLITNFPSCCMFVILDKV